MKHKTKSRFQQITTAAVWMMLIATLGSLILGAITSLGLI